MFGKKEERTVRRGCWHLKVGRWKRGGGFGIVGYRFAATVWVWRDWQQVERSIPPLNIYALTLISVAVCCQALAVEFLECFWRVLGKVH
jgi:hypothetical protein